MSKIGICVDIVGALGGGGKPQMHGRSKMIENGPPGAFIVGRAPVALVYDDQIEKIFRVFSVIAADILPLGNGLVYGKKDMGVGGNHTITPPDLLAVNFQQIFFIGIKGVDGLVGQNIAVCQKENPWTAGAGLLLVPTGLKQFMNNLEGDVGFARAGCQCQQYPRFCGPYGIRCRVNRKLLIITGAHPGFQMKGDVAKLPAKIRGIILIAGQEFFGCWIFISKISCTCCKVKFIYLVAVRGINKPYRKFFCVVNGLLEPLGWVSCSFLGLNNGKMLIVTVQQIINKTTAATLSGGEFPAIGEIIFTSNLATVPATRG